MPNVTVTCDRCKRQVEGIESETFTGGFYRRSGHDVVPGGWEQLFNEDENIVCDACMHADPRYRALYHLPLPSNTIPKPEVTFTVSPDGMGAHSHGHVAAPWDIDIRGIHCDPLILHSPGTCCFCDEHGADLQTQRRDKNIAFTDDIGYQYLPCPAIAARGPRCQEWGGLTGFGGNKPAGTRAEYEAKWAEWHRQLDAALERMGLS